VVDTHTLEGIIGACLTPFTDDSHIDGDALEQELEFMLGHCDAVSILGAEASEYRFLSGPARREWLGRGIRYVAGRRPVLAGASATDVAEVLELAELGASAGADMAQVLIPLRPWGTEPTTTELVDFFEALCKRSALPLVAYHNPTRGADPSIEALIRLCELDRVVGFKESSRDMAKIGRLIVDIDVAGHAGYFTTMQPLLATLLQGGSGAMMPAPATLFGAEVVAALRRGDVEGAANAQRRFAHFPSQWKAYGLPPVMKCALSHLGVPVGECLPPFGRVSGDDSRAIKAFLTQAGAIEASNH
jgi:4-hydroxy-tetrahydrodipicolinate synthase